MDSIVRKIIFITSAILLTVSSMAAQWSLYTSLSSGYHSNPLYNYQRESDQLRQIYVESGYRRATSVSLIDLRYVGGYLQFNRFTDRTYYEHSLTIRYSRQFAPGIATPNSAATDMPSLHINGAGSEDSTETQSADNSQEEEMEEDTWNEDGRGTLLELTVRPSARHDREMYKEFDNAGVDISTGIRTLISDKYTADAENIAGFRQYNFLTDLSNMVEQVRLRAGVLISPSVETGLQVWGGIKKYFRISYDTSRFEESESYVVVLSKVYQGKQLIRIDTSYEPSVKTVVKRPSNNLMLQIAPGAYGNAKWEGGNFFTTASYRFNAPTSLHALVLNVQSRSLNEDLYNDHFSYNGPDVQMELHQIFPFNIQVALSVDWSIRRFEYPAFDLAGYAVSSQRTDTRSSTDIYIARSFPVSERLSLECAIGMNFMRNRSNDAYNDYSLSSISLIIGAGI